MASMPYPHFNSLGLDVNSNLLRQWRIVYGIYIRMVGP